MQCDAIKGYTNEVVRMQGQFRLNGFLYLSVPILIVRELVASPVQG